MKIANTILALSGILISPLSAQVEQPEAKLEVFATLDQAVGNIAFTHDGKLIMSHHPFFKPENRVVRYDATSQKVVPFPNKAWNTPRTENDWYLDDVLGLRNDSKGNVWILDMGTRGNITPKLVGWNTKTDKLERIYYLPAPAVNKNSQPNDFVIDEKRQLVVIADEGIGRGGDGSKAALIVLDLKSGKTRRLLEGHSTTMPDRKSPIVVDGKALSVSKNGKAIPIFVGADGITLGQNDEWLYFAPLNGSKIYRIKMDHIANESLSPTDLAKAIKTYSNKPNNGGLTADSAGNLYMTNVESHSIGFVNSTNQKLSVLASDPRMLWPDGISANNDGFMYVSAAQVHLGGVFNNGNNKAKAPYYVFRFKPVAKGIFGR